MTTPPGQRVLVLGGARSGKSAAAERRLGRVTSVTYVATSGRRPDDMEWAERVAAHRAARPTHWRTVETTDLVGVLTAATEPILVDCLTLWLAAVMDEADAWNDESWYRSAARTQVAERIDALVDSWAATTVPLVGVSNETGLGVVPDTASGRRFRDELGWLNQRVAAVSDEVVLVVAGRELRLPP
ncbi:MAG TPA: bifunctional adenosylcobinamide kinase/adenosylcobinamide-phosphate guanylyltransferase [Actinomycetes bacterium]|nr:bifunctional adenosylcobinamide kinase/adenosylcobinamide-phosphate guanylyltransferase [Actinomycetes bacterium]